MRFAWNHPPPFDAVEATHFPGERSAHVRVAHYQRRARPPCGRVADWRTQSEHKRKFRKGKGLKLPSESATGGKELAEWRTRRRVAAWLEGAMRGRVRQFTEVLLFHSIRK